VTLLSARALNRATLDRQLLLRRWDLTVPQALQHLVGLQAQTPHTWYVGLWTRLSDYAPEPTAQLLRDAGVVRIALMRAASVPVAPGLPTTAARQARVLSGAASP
jgi:hypothetical protein